MIRLTSGHIAGCAGVGYGASVVEAEAEGVDGAFGVGMRFDVVGTVLTMNFNGIH